MMVNKVFRMSNNDGAGRWGLHGARSAGWVLTGMERGAPRRGQASVLSWAPGGWVLFHSLSKVGGVLAPGT